jgi:predicted molibdopterin-dependent oxidoreductase YjgC
MAGRVAAVISTAATVEEMYLFKLLAEGLEIGRIRVATWLCGERQAFKSGFSVERDKTPNAWFARKLWGDAAVESGLEGLAAEIQKGEIRGMFAMNGSPWNVWPADLEDCLHGLNTLIVCDVLDNAVARQAHVLIPGRASAEKDGTVVNMDGRVQRIRKAVDPPEGTLSELDFIQDLLCQLGVRDRKLSCEGVFEEASEAIR